MSGHTEQMAEPPRERERVTAVAEEEEEECSSDHCDTLLENTSRCPDVRIPSKRMDLTVDS